MTADDDGAPAPASPEVSVWPAGAQFPEMEAVGCSCDACGRLWRVHRDLAGFRLRCACGAWVDVPGGEDSRRALRLVEPGEAGRRALAWPVYESALATDQLQAPELTPRAERRWLDRTLVELIGMVGAFWLPALVISFAFAAHERALYQPLASFSACVLVLVVGFTSSRYTFGGLRGASPRYFAEALGATAAFLAVALSMLAAVKRGVPGYEDPVPEFVAALGLTMALLCIAVVPAIFEELAFRGLIQGRFEVLYGAWSGVLLAGCAFGLAHGVSFATPIHVGLGVYLGWLRQRSGSLLPGMLLHFLYNGTLVYLSA